ncbi:MAG: tryptophan 7-halogenase [Gemmatimonadetes bacterium]|nr:tryptophan 7-halogenase [Gemmatimonadota bacterium]
MDARRIDTDVLIVGGGPAGAAAAITCARNGVRVMLCERDATSGERPGETLHPGIEPLLAQLGVADRLAAVTGARHPGIWIEWGSARRFEGFGGDEHGAWRGFQVWRADFDAMLLDRARELGVDVRRPCAATGVLDDARTRTTDGVVSARVRVDATGRARWLGRALGVPAEPRSRRLFARYGYVEGECPPRDDAPALVADVEGWTWTARVKPRLYQWTRVAFNGERTAADWLPDEFAGMTRRGPARGADVTWRMAERVADADWFMVGDAAATLDPTSSHGVLRALTSGMMAGHLATAIVQERAPAHEAAAVYHGWLADWFAADAARLGEFYRRLNVEV